MVDRTVLEQIVDLNAEMSAMEISNTQNESIKIADNTTHTNLLTTCIPEEDCEMPEESCSSQEPTIPDTENLFKPRRSLRKRIRTLDVLDASKARFKIQRLAENFEIEDYYLNKQVKRLPSSLETIFEEPKIQKNRNQYVSGRKFKRIITFNNGNRVAIKELKRTAKIGKLATKRFINRKKMSMEAFLKRLEELDPDDEHH